MKKIFLLLLILQSSTLLFSQKDWACYINFENNTYCYEDTLFIDNLSNPNNIWQIGVPNKALFDTAYSIPKAIVTNLDSVYPINDTSSFTIIHTINMALFNLGGMWIDAKYKINSDTLTDYGKIEFSPDNGMTWINAYTDSVYFASYENPKPALSGKSNGWQNLYVRFWDQNHHYNFSYGDTVLWKFTFISDSIQTNKDGWMLDNIDVNDWYEGIQELFPETIHTYAFPNPATDHSTILFDNKNNSVASLVVFDALNRTIMKRSEIKGSETIIDVSNFPPGVYFYKIYNEQIQGNGKIIIK
jgi:hypothetical protein